MKRSAAISIVIALVLLLVSVILHYAHEFIFYRLTVLEVPIRFEGGFSISREFTVDIPANYSVGIRYDEIFRSTVAVPIPQDEFTAESEVRLRGKVIANGGTTRLPGWTGAWASNRDQVTRYLGSFHAEPRKKYSVSLHITSLLPGLIGKNPKVLVEIEPRFTPFYELRKLLFTSVAAGIGLVLILVCAYIAVRWRRNVCDHGLAA